MKTATRIGLLILLVAAAGIALAQLNGPPGGGPRRGGPPPGDESGPDEGRPHPWAPRGEVGRFAIVSIGSGGPMLLDSANGDTWSFVADDTAAKGHWEPVNRRMPERRERRPPRDERESSGGPPSDGPRGNRSGPESDRDN